MLTGPFCRRAAPPTAFAAASPGASISAVREADLQPPQWGGVLCWESTRRSSEGNRHGASVPRRVQSQPSSSPSWQAAGPRRYHRGPKIAGRDLSRDHRVPKSEMCGSCAVIGVTVCVVLAAAASVDEDLLRPRRRTSSVQRNLTQACLQRRKPDLSNQAATWRPRELCHLAIDLSEA